MERTPGRRRQQQPSLALCLKWHSLRVVGLLQISEQIVSTDALVAVVNFIAVSIDYLNTNLASRFDMCMPTMFHVHHTVKIVNEF